MSLKRLLTYPTLVVSLALIGIAVVAGTAFLLPRAASLTRPITCTGFSVTQTDTTKTVDGEQYMRVDLSSKQSTGFGQDFAGTIGRAIDFTDHTQIGETKPVVRDPHIWVRVGHSVNVEVLAETKSGEGSWCGIANVVKPVSCSGVTVSRVSDDEIKVTGSGARVGTKTYRGITANFSQDHNNLGEPKDSPRSVTFKVLTGSDIYVLPMAVMTDGSKYVCNRQIVVMT